MALSRQRRRLQAAKPPRAASMAYQRLVTEFFEAWQRELEKLFLQGWEQNPVHASGAVPRADASNYVHRKLEELRLRLEERFDPGTQLSRDVRTVAARVNQKNEIEFRRVVGIRGRELLKSDQSFLLDAFRDRNVNLIKSLQGEQLDSITTLLGKAEAGGWRVEELRKSLQEQFGVTRKKADLLARDQVLKLNGQLTQTRHQNAGITHYIWTTAGDERVRGNPNGLWPKGLHYELDGTKQAWAAPPVISLDGRTGHPGDDYQCRCVAFPVLPELDEDGEDE